MWVSFVVSLVTVILMRFGKIKSKINKTLNSKGIRHVFSSPWEPDVASVPASPFPGLCAYSVLLQEQVEVAMPGDIEGVGEGGFLSPRASGAWLPLGPSGPTGAQDGMGTKLSVW